MGQSLHCAGIIATVLTATWARLRHVVGYDAAAFTVPSSLASSEGTDRTLLVAVTH
jgi:hypothetical protein